MFDGGISSDEDSIIGLGGRAESQRWIHFRWACAKFLRETLHDFAALSIPQCAWPREFYQRQRAKGKGHHAAVRALAYKWIRILFRCWQSRTPYQEDIYLLAQRCAPADRQMVSPPRPNSAATPAQATDPRLGIVACGGTVDLQWKQVGGFWNNIRLQSLTDYFRFTKRRPQRGPQAKIGHEEANLRTRAS